MRIYIIGKDGIALCREPPTTVNDGEVAVADRPPLFDTGQSVPQRQQPLAAERGRRAILHSKRRRPRPH